MCGGRRWALRRAPWRLAAGCLGRLGGLSERRRGPHGDSQLLGGAPVLPSNLASVTDTNIGFVAEMALNNPAHYRNSVIPSFIPHSVTDGEYGRTEARVDQMDRTQGRPSLLSTHNEPRTRRCTSAPAGCAQLHGGGGRPGVLPRALGAGQEGLRFFPEGKKPWAYIGQLPGLSKPYFSHLCFSLSPFYSAGSPASADRRRVTMEIPIRGPEETDQTHSRVKFLSDEARGTPATPFACCYVGG